MNRPQYASREAASSEDQLGSATFSDTASRDLEPLGVSGAPESFNSPAWVFPAHMLRTGGMAPRP